ncbi:hypothetical protein Tco_1352162 [Tanacetum coccineum]
MCRSGTTVQDGKVVVQDVRGRYNTNNQGRPFQRNNTRGVVGTGNAGGQNRDDNMNPDQAKPIMCYNCKGIGHIAREFPQPKCPLDSDYFKYKMLLMNAHENGVVLDEEQLFHFTARSGPSYDSNTVMWVQDHDTFVDHMDEYHEVHEMQNDVQHNYVVDSDAEYTSDSNVIPYNQYMEDNEEHVVQSNVSSVRNDALMSIIDDMHEQGVQSMSMSNHARPVVHGLEDTGLLAVDNSGKNDGEHKSLYGVEIKLGLPLLDYSEGEPFATFAPQRTSDPRTDILGSNRMKMNGKRRDISYKNTFSVDSVLTQLLLSRLSQSSST